LSFAFFSLLAAAHLAAHAARYTMRVAVALFLQCGSKTGGDASWFRAFDPASFGAFLRCSTLVEYLGCANVGGKLGFGYSRRAESFVVARRA
jgi:hypothetical protein